MERNYSPFDPANGWKTANATPPYSVAALEALARCMCATANPPAAAPSFSPLPGDFSASQSLVIYSANGGVIFYTLDGSTPTYSSAQYSGPITISGASTTVKAFVVAPGYTDSPVTTGVYTITAPLTVVTPTFSPISASFIGGVAVTIATVTPSAEIRWTDDGSTPGPGSNLYTGPITVTTTKTLRAIGIRSGYTDSSVAVQLYTIIPVVVAPVMSPVGGTFSGTQSVTLSTTTPSATIYYTTNGTNPTTSSTQYTGAITVASTTTIKAFAVRSGYADSAVTTEVYTIIPVAVMPVLTPTGGTFGSTVTLSMSTTTPGATIYYTTNGSTPSAGSTVYSGSISISATTTVKAIAIKSGYTDSPINTQVYTISLADWSGYTGSSLNPLLPETSWDADFVGGAGAGGFSFTFTQTDWKTLDHFISFGATVAAGGSCPGPYRYYIRQQIADPPNTSAASGFFMSFDLTPSAMAGSAEGYTDTDSHGWPCKVVTRSDASVWVMYRIKNQLNGAATLRVRSNTGA